MIVSSRMHAALGGTPVLRSPSTTISPAAMPKSCDRFTNSSVYRWASCATACRTTTRLRPMDATTRKPLRCAIYTRKSTELGLVLEFNSLQPKQSGQVKLASKFIFLKSKAMESG
jgi:hypothetical protein